jgi:ABC-type transport system substrate-binding protein
VNHKRAPFDTLAVRRAVSLAMDRHAYVKGVRHNGALVGAALMPPAGHVGSCREGPARASGLRRPGP